MWLQRVLSSNGSGFNAAEAMFECTYDEEHGSKSGLMSNMESKSHLMMNIESKSDLMSNMDSSLNDGDCDHHIESGQSP